MSTTLRPLRAAEAAIEEAQSTPSPVELRIREQVLDQLGSDAFLAARRDAHVLSLAHAVSYALCNVEGEALASPRDPNR